MRERWENEGWRLQNPLTERRAFQERRPGDAGASQYRLMHLGMALIFGLK